MKPLIVALDGNDHHARALESRLGVERAGATIRRFPDGESYVRLEEESCEGREAIVVASLDRPDAKVTQMLMVAETLRDLGVRRIGLVAPYLAYMRQDKRFHPGEGLTSRYFGRLVSRHFDWMACVEPHLHRYDSLDEVYDIPTRHIRATDPMADWVRRELETPILVGPDDESSQWVERVAEAAGAPHVILEKIRHGDRDVDISVSGVPFEQWGDRTPVLLDDIISTGGTMAETVRLLRERGAGDPVCLGVHAIMVGEADAKLREAGASRVVTTNTIDHPSNAIDVQDVLAEAVDGLIA